MARADLIAELAAARDVHDTLAQARSRSLPPSQLALVGRLRGAGPEPLTGREIEVLEHVAAGRSNRAVVRALAIGDATVKTPPAARLPQARGRGPNICP